MYCFATLSSLEEPAQKILLGPNLVYLCRSREVKTYSNIVAPDLHNVCEYYAQVACK